MWKVFSIYNSISTNLGLEDVFDDDELCALFIEFMHKMHSQETIEFWIEVEMYKRLTCGVEVVKVAKRIYNTYLIQGAQFELTISYDVKEEIRKKIEEGAQVYDQTLFDEAQIAIYNMLTFDCLRSFLESNPPRINIGKKISRVFQMSDLPRFDPPRLTLAKHLEAFREQRRRLKRESTSRRRFEVANKILPCVC